MPFYRERDPVRECCTICFLTGPLLLYLSIKSFTSAVVDTRSDAIDQLKPYVDAWTGGKRAQFESVSYTFAVNGFPANLEAVTTGDPVPNLTPLYGSSADSVRRSDWTALRYTTPEGCAPTASAAGPPCIPPPPPPPGDLTFTLAESSELIAGRDSATITLDTPGLQACAPLQYDSANGGVSSYLQLTRVTAVVDPTKPLAAQTITGFANCSSVFGTHGAMTSQGTIDMAQSEWSNGLPCSWTAFGSYEKVVTCRSSGPVLTVRSIDDPFIAAAIITDFTLDFGKSANSKAGVAFFELIAGLIWTAATWGLVFYYYKKTGYHIWNAKAREQQRATEQQHQMQQAPGATTAANPVSGAAMPLATAVAIPGAATAANPVSVATMPLATAVAIPVADEDICTK